MVSKLLIVPLPSKVAPKVRWAIILLLALSHMMAFVDRFVVSVVAGPLKTDFSLSDTALGGLEGLAFAIPYAIAVIPLGRLADRIAPRALIVSGAVLWTLASASCAFTQSFGEMVGGRMLMGIGQAAFTPAALALLAGLASTRDAAGPLSVFTAGSTLGKSVALLAGGAAFALLSAKGPLYQFAGSTPWRGVFLLTAAPNILLILLMVFMLGHSPSPRAERRREQGPSVWLVSHGRSFFSHAAVAIAPLILIQGAAAWAPIFYMRYFGLTVTRTALLVGSVVLAAAPLGHLLGGQVTAALSRRGVAPGVVVAAILVATAPVAAFFCFSRSLVLSLGAYGMMVLLLGIAAPAGLAGIRLLTPTDRLGAGNGVFMSLTTLVGVGLAPTLVGFLNDVCFGGPQGLNLSLMSLVCGTSLLGVGLAAVFAPEWTRTAQTIDNVGEPASRVRNV